MYLSDRGRKGDVCITTFHLITYLDLCYKMKEEILTKTRRNKERVRRKGKRLYIERER